MGVDCRDLCVSLSGGGGPAGKRASPGDVSTYLHHTNQNGRAANPSQLVAITAGGGAVGKPTPTAVTSRSSMGRHRPTNEPINPYRVLELRRDATPAEIRNSYKRLALWHHPGRGRVVVGGGGGGGAASNCSRAQAFEILAACYETLVNGESRRRYDSQLRETEQASAVSRRRTGNGVYRRRQQQRHVAHKNKNETSHHISSANSQALMVAFEDDDDDDDENDDSEIDETGTASTTTMSSVWGNTESKRPMKDLYKARRHKKKNRHRPGGKGRHNHRTGHPPRGGKRKKHHQNETMPLPGLVRVSSSHSSSSSSSDSEADDGFNEEDPVMLSSQIVKPAQSTTPLTTTSDRHTADCVGAAGNRGLCYNPMTTASDYFSCSTSRWLTMTKPTSSFPKALADSSSSASHPSGEEEAEKHFSEVVVNRLFGGPLAPLHRARNFAAFTDPYVIFEKVFGGPIFPKSSQKEEQTEQDQGRPEGNNLLVQSSPWSHHAGWHGSTQTQSDDGLTTVVETSRILGLRKVTRIETIRVNPTSGRKTSVITVRGEDLEPVIPHERSVTGLDCLLLCFNDFDDWCGGGSGGGVGNDRIPKRLDTTANSPLSPPTSDRPLTQHQQHSVLTGILQEFYDCHHNLYDSCTKYLSCSCAV